MHRARTKRLSIGNRHGDRGGRAGYPRPRGLMTLGAGLALALATAVAGAPAALAAQPPPSSTTLYTTTSGSGTSCTLSEPCGSVQAAVNAAGGYSDVAVTVDVSAGTFGELQGVTIPSGAEASLAIVGAGAASTTVEPSGGGLELSRPEEYRGPPHASVFTITGGFPVTLEALTITGGDPPAGGAGADGNSGGNGGNGGGIDDTAAPLTVAYSTISSNVTGAGGAGGSADGSVGGYGGYGGSGGNGGGIYDTAAGLTISDSVISGNSTGPGAAGGSGDCDLYDDCGSGGNGGNGGNGGGIYDSGTGLTISDSIVTGNETGAGSSDGGEAVGDSFQPVPGDGGNGGGILDTANGLVTYVAPPAVTGVSPGSGPTAGGTSVTITGTGFTGATKVLFGTVAATSFTVVSPTQITAVSPAQGALTHNVFVTTPNGTSATVTADEFTYT